LYEIPNHFHLPARLQRLADLAYNLWWTWNADAGNLFPQIDPVLWEATSHNPVVFLREVQEDRLQTVLEDPAFLHLYDRVIDGFDDYMRESQTWYSENHPDRLNQPIAYFSTEFGLHEALPIYAGGLGILSGDHLKEASDFGIPIVAMGFLYTQGYFRQRITEDGWQEAEYASLSFTDLPVIPVTGQDKQPLTVPVELAGREIQARIWCIQVGRVPLFLLDSNIDANPIEDRDLTARLYISDLESRISQEIILGIGGVRALRALGYNPAVWHLNEGHSSFLILERIRELTAGGLPFRDAYAKVVQGTVFTTHTPVPAGHDEFPLWLVDKYFSRYWSDLGLDRESFIDTAREERPWGETFSMATLAIRASSMRNGVSALHGQVAREMWSHVWPDLSPSEVPIDHITNGIHIMTWLARRIRTLYDEYLDPAWLQRLDDPEIWHKIDDIPEEELWEIHRHLKRKLAAYMRARVRPAWMAGRVHPVQVVASGALLDPYALTIGFARRFATYKRANLILRQPERLLDIVNDSERPVQVIFAGKAHPADEPGKQLIQDVYRFVKRSENGGRLVFLEDYDMNLARYLLQGVDVWLNTPRRPNEASGTSGEKAAINGVVNFSILDGWWQEGYNGQNGWAIGDRRDYSDPAIQDEGDAESLYRTLEEEIIPLYYERSAKDIPMEWVRLMKSSMQTLTPRFSMTRMMKEYISKMYIPAMAESAEG
jgi:starch phosphorylase